MSTIFHSSEHALAVIGEGARSLAKAGFTVDAETDVANPARSKVHVEWSGRPLGPVRFAATCGQPQWQFHEVKCSPFIPALEAAIGGNKRLSRMYAEAAERYLDDSDIDVHAYLAAAGTPGIPTSSYAGVIECAGERLGELVGRADAPSADAEAVGATRLLERCEDRGIPRVAIHVSPHLVMMAHGRMKGWTPSRMAFVDAVRATPLEVAWLLRKDDAYGTRHAKHCARRDHETFLDGRPA